MPKVNMKSLKTFNYQKYAVPVVFILLFAIIGALLLHGSKAAGPYASVEASSGTLTNGATSITDSSASNNSYVQFGTESTGGSSNGGCTSGSNPAPCMNGSNNGTGASGWGSPVFDDEFNGSSLDTSRWADINWGGNSTANVAESGGDLVLTAPSAGSDARISSGPDLGAGNNGYYLPVGSVVEARINMPDPLSCAWATFWATGDNGNWPGTGEVDIIEGDPNGTICPTSYNTNYHDSAGGSWEYSYPSVAGSFHTYTFVRGSGTNGYKVYLDGNLVAQWTSGDDGTDEEAITLSIGNTSGTYPQQMVVDYVRAWQ